VQRITRHTSHSRGETLSGKQLSARKIRELIDNVRENGLGKNTKYCRPIRNKRKGGGERGTLKNSMVRPSRQKRGENKHCIESGWGKFLLKVRWR